MVLKKDKTIDGEVIGEQTFSLYNFRYYCREIFGIKTRTFDGVVRHNGLKMNDSVTKGQFIDYIDKYQKHEVIK